MTREEEIHKAAEKFAFSDKTETPDFYDVINDFYYGAKWADKTMIDKACKCYCDDICDKGQCGMCFHKHDDNGQIKNVFQYNECNELKLIRKTMEE